MPGIQLLSRGPVRDLSTTETSGILSQVCWHPIGIPIDSLAAGC